MQIRFSFFLYLAKALTFPDSQFIIDGFTQPYRLDRNKPGGGVMIFVSENIPSKLVSKHTLPDDIEGMFIEIN